MSDEHATATDVSETPAVSAALDAFLDAIRPQTPWAQKKARLDALRAALEPTLEVSPREVDAFLGLFGRDESVDAKFDTLMSLEPYAIGEQGVIRLIDALREMADDLDAPTRAAFAERDGRTKYVGIFGTGGDRREDLKVNTLNVSTLASLLAAAVRDADGRPAAPIVKVGSPAVTSNVGASNLIEQLRDAYAAPDQIAEQLARFGFVFVAPGELGIPYQANLVEARRRVFRSGAVDLIKIAVPAACLMDPKAQVTGISDPRMLPFVIAAFEHLIDQGVLERGIVLHSYAGVDELYGESLVIDLDADGMRGREWTPERFGLADCDGDELSERDDLESQADYSRRVIAEGAAPDGLMDLLIWNAAIILALDAGLDEMDRHIARVREAVESGAAAHNFEQFLAYDG